MSCKRSRVQSEISVYRIFHEISHLLSKADVFISRDNAIDSPSISTFPTSVKREENIGYWDHGSFVSQRYRARCFGGFRFANGRFRFVVLTVNDRPIARGGRSGPQARINGVD